MLTTQRIDSPEYHAIRTPSLLKLAELFKSNQHEIRIAGGAVRDILMGITPHDVDFATTATPDQMKEMFTRAHVRMINSNGEKHGTITVRVDDADNFEITTLRIDLVTDGRHALVEFTQDWEVDASRRDLTMNALFLDLNGVVYDYFNGIDDLQHRRVRFVGEPVQRIQEDYLRILRYFRFFGRLAHDGARPDATTLQAIRDHAVGLQSIAGERLWIELKRIAEGRNAGPMLRLMLEQHLGQYLGIPSDADLTQLEEHWRQCHQANPHAVTILTKLVRNADELDKFEQRMKYSNDCRRLSQLILTQRDSITVLDSSAVDRLKPYKDLLLDLVISDPTAKEKVLELLKYQHHLDAVQPMSDWILPRFPITGDMLASKGIKQGPNYKTILNDLREAWKQSHYQASENQLLEQTLPTVLQNIARNSASNSTTNNSAASLPKKTKTK